MPENLPAPRRRGELVVPQPPLVCPEPVRLPASYSPAEQPPPQLPVPCEPGSLLHALLSTPLKPGEVIEYERVQTITLRGPGAPERRPREGARRRPRKRGRTPLWLLLVLVFGFLIAWAVVHEAKERPAPPPPTAPPPGFPRSDPFQPWR